MDNIFGDYKIETIKIEKVEPRNIIPKNLIRTNANYYDSLKLVPAKSRISSSTDELNLQLELEKSNQDPRKADVFDDLFGRNESQWYAWQWTSTALRVPSGAKPDDFEKRGKNKYYLRQVLENDKVIGEILIPEGNGRIITKWNEKFGLPEETVYEKGIKYHDHTTHFYFESIPRKDDISGYFDVAVARRAYGRHDDLGWCLDVDADHGRWFENSFGSFRPIEFDL